MTSFVSLWYIACREATDMGTILAIDSSILLFIQENFRHDFWTAIMKTITLFGDYGGLFWILSALTLTIIKKTRKVGICLTVAELFSGVFTNLIIKNLVNRTRPYEIIDGLVPLGRIPTDSSFPSGHASIAFAASIALFLALPLIMNKKTAHRIGAAVIAFAVLISFSRLYLAVHFPTDVLAGMILGIIYGIAGAALGKLIINHLPERWFTK